MGNSVSGGTPTFVFQTSQTNTEQMDIFGSTAKIKKDLADDLVSILAGLTGDKEVLLSNGMAVNPQTPTGMAVATAWIQQLMGISSFVDSSFAFIRNMEKSLAGLSSGS